MFQTVPFPNITANFQTTLPLILLPIFKSPKIFVQFSYPFESSKAIYKKRKIVPPTLFHPENFEFLSPLLYLSFFPFFHSPVIKREALHIFLRLPKAFPRVKKCEPRTYLRSQLNFLGIDSRYLLKKISAKPFSTMSISFGMARLIFFIFLVYDPQQSPLGGSLKKSTKGLNFNSNI